MEARDTLKVLVTNEHLDNELQNVSKLACFHLYDDDFTCVCAMAGYSKAGEK